VRAWLLARRRVRTTLLLVVWAACVGAPVILLVQAHERGVSSIEQRFGLRASLTASFASAYVHERVTRQQAQAANRLDVGTVSESEFVKTVNDAGFAGAELLDDSGRVLNTAPTEPVLSGANLARGYPYIADAVAGHVAVSAVVPSVAHGAPVVAFAVPFATRWGRRVFTGEYDISHTPLGSYLERVIPLSGAEAFLVDPAGAVIASNAGVSSRALSVADPALARRVARRGEGAVEIHGKQPGWFATRAISGTPWRVVIAAPDSLLFQSIGGAAQWLPWLMLAGFAVLGLLVVYMLERLSTGRARLTRLNRELDRVARIDSLTGVHNRRHAEEALRAAIGSARRHETSLGLAIVDIDNFKRFNDSYGHQVGDETLRRVAGILQNGLRVEDVLGRWGGEEFIVVLPGADAEHAALVAERLRTEIAASSLDLVDDAGEALTVTIGVAAWRGQDVEELVGQADAALYEGKASGRNVVRLHRSAPSSSAVPVTL
jgi:diguanylate cyclase (GGDEF)-like protein